MSADKSQAESGVNYGRRLLPHALDELAKIEPDRAYVSIPQSSFINKGMKDITVKQVANAVNNLAWWIEKNCGKPKTEFDTLAYVGVSDIRYAILLNAAIKSGYKALFPSLRNSVSMNVSLVEQTKCTTFVCAEQHRSKFQQVIDETKDENAKIFIIPEVDELINGDAEEYEYNKTYEEAMWDPVVVLHSSGSTGLPKCITLNNACLTRVDNDHNVPKISGRQIYNFTMFNEAERHYLAFPPFHLSGMIFLCTVPVYFNMTIVMGPPDRPPSGQVIGEIISVDEQVRGAIAPPSILEQFVNEPGSIELAKKLSFVAFAGGPLATAAGNLLSTVTNVRQYYGATEFLFAELMCVEDRKDWEYMEFHPLYPIEFQEDADGTYELVMKSSGGAPELQMIKYSMPGVPEYRTKDLFRKHPTKPNLWKYDGRKDDIIVLSNGEKMNPVPMENMIAGHPLISGCVIVGQGRFQSALIVETSIPTDDTDSVIEKIWPRVQEANALAPGHARVLKSMIIVAPPNKPFPRAGKGTVLRKKAIQLLSAEIDALYGEEVTPAPVQAPKEEAKKTTPRPKPQHRGSVSGSDSVKQLIRSALASAFSAGNLADTEDFYVNGLDSLSTIDLANTLKKELKKVHKDADLSWIQPTIIYGNPTIEKLANRLASGLHLPSASGTPNAVPKPATPAERAQRLAAMVNKYTADLTFTIRPNTQLTVILTGSTGALGSHLLHNLLNDPYVDHVYCLNRSADAKHRHEEGLFKGRDLSKATFLQASFGHPTFGLPATTYWDLVDKVDVILHNAWKVDFNHALESFEDVHIRGVRNFIDFSMKATTRHPHIYFVSSISAVGNCGLDHIPETVPDDLNAALPMGYGESKLVSERMLMDAVTTAGIRASVLRLGQVGGPVEDEGLGGEWNRHEWFPSLVKTSKTLGCVPENLADPDWVPIDRLATIMCEIIHNSANAPRVYNLCNPEPGPWAELVKVMKRTWGPETREVTLKEWVDILERSPKERNDYEDKPALKLLPFFKSLLEGTSAGLGTQVVWETTHGQAGSRVMAALEPVNQEWMEKWLKQWQF